MRNIVTSKGYVVDVDSSMIQTIAHSHKAGTLWVKFKQHGKCYCYAQVATEHALSLRLAQSHGTYMNTNIKTRYQGFNGFDYDFDSFCKILLSELSLPEPMTINWPAVRASADNMVWH
jgi:hypothetical protein